MPDDDDDFIDAFNEELDQHGCGARVRRPRERWHAGSLQIVDLDGKTIGFVPDTIEAIEMAAFMRIVERTFEEGVLAGQRFADRPRRLQECGAAH